MENDHCISEDAANQNGWTLFSATRKHNQNLIDYCHQGNVAGVEEFLSCPYATPSLNAQSSYFSSTPLMMACQNSHLDVVKILFAKSDEYTDPSKKIDVNLTNDEGDTALLIACSFGEQENQVEILRILLERGADVNMTNVYKESAMELCIISDFKEGFKILLSTPSSPPLTKETLDKLYKRVIEEYYTNDETNEMDETDHMYDYMNLLNAKKNKNISKLADLALKTVNKNGGIKSSWPEHVKEVFRYAQMEETERSLRPARGGKKRNRKVKTNRRKSRKSRKSNKKQSRRRYRRKSINARF
jgi:hypothetical protein